MHNQKISRNGERENNTKTPKKKLRVPENYWEPFNINENWICAINNMKDLMANITKKKKNETQKQNRTIGGRLCFSSNTKKEILPKWNYVK